MVSMNTNVLRDDKVARQPPNRAVERTAGSPSLAAAAHRRRSAYKPSDQEGDSATVRAPMGT